MIFFIRFRKKFTFSKVKMNIFFLDFDPKKCAQYHTNKHVVKMILEHVQLLCSAHHVCGSQNKQFKIPYKLTHKNHPSAIWTRKSIHNYLFLIKLTEELCKEYTFRYKKIHKCQQYLVLLKENLPNIQNKEEFTPPLQAMPDMYKDSNDCVEAYRHYYFFEKQHLFEWKDRSVPQWIKDMEKIFI